MFRKVIQWIFRKRIARRAAIRTAMAQYESLGAQRDWWFDHAQALFEEARRATHDADKFAKVSQQCRHAARRHAAICEKIFSIEETITNKKR